MTIYFAGSIRGGRDDQTIYAEIIEKLLAYGTVNTEHVGLASLGDQGEIEKTDTYIFERDMGWLREANVIVAEVTNPSLGVGYELGQAEALKKTVLCLYRSQEAKRLSGMISGNQYFHIAQYQNTNDLDSLLQNFFNSIKPLN